MVQIHYNVSICLQIGRGQSAFERKRVGRELQGKLKGILVFSPSYSHVFSKYYQAEVGKLVDLESNFLFKRIN